MKPAAFAYVRAEDREHALQLLADHGGDAKVLAGGQSLGPLMNLRLANPVIVVDVNELHDLSTVDFRTTSIAIGALTRHRTLERDPTLFARQPLLAQAATKIGHPSIRNRGTFAGSLAHADPAAELPAVAVALDATVEVSTRRDVRLVAAAALIDGPFSTTISPDELITAIHVPDLPPRTGTSWTEFAPRHGDFSYVGAAAVITTDNSRCSRARLVLSGVGPTPQRADVSGLVGQSVEEADFDEIGHVVAGSLDPSSDVGVPADYKRRLAAHLAALALRNAWVAA